MLMEFTGKPGLSYGQVQRLFHREQVEAFTVKNNTLTLRLREPMENGDTTASYKLTDFDVFYADMGPLIEKQMKSGILLDYNYDLGFQPPWWFALIPTVVLVIAFIAFAYLSYARQNAGGDGSIGGNANKFGKARTHDGDDTAKKVTFQDVAGAVEEKAELQELVDFLKDPQKFIALGARIPKGVLLVGPPGTGKTLLARAVAGEAGVKFLSISGSDFVELYVGIGASRVRDLFDQAKKDSPAIVFIDEIDAVGRQRGTGLGGGHDEREQTLNQLLVEMDGFSANEGVIVLAATNRQDILDPALLRPGRFDRQVFVGYPDTKGREAILKIHARNKPLAEDVDLAQVAQATGSFTGADLENLMNEAALFAARTGEQFITQSDLQASVIKVIAGPEKKSHTVIEQERRLTAYHEAGHAIVIHSLPTQDPVHQISIVPRGGAGGMTISLPQEDRGFHSKKELTDRITTFLGGRVAEQLVLGDSSTGASNDLERATALARAMVTKYGMSDTLGAVVFDAGHDEIFIGRSMAQQKTYSEDIAGKIDVEIRKLVDGAQDRCKVILEKNRPQLETIAQFLLKNEVMSAEEFEAVFTSEEGTTTHA
ncbi:MAG: ATP-dependent zinc metalloprotease FtsH [Oscillospiraceae bacterium]